MFTMLRKKRKQEVEKLKEKNYKLLKEKARVRVQKAAALEQYYEIAKKIKNLNSNELGEIRLEQVVMYEEVIEEFLKLGFSINKSFQNYGNCVYTITFFDSENGKRGIYKVYNQHGILCKKIEKFDCDLDVPYDTPYQQQRAFNVNAFYYRKRSEKYKIQNRKTIVLTTLKLKEYVIGLINDFQNRKKGYFYLEEDEVNQDIIDLIGEAKLSIKKFDIGNGTVRYKCFYLSNYKLSK